MEQLTRDAGRRETNNSVDVVRECTAMAAEIRGQDAIRSRNMFGKSVRETAKKKTNRGVMRHE